MLIQRLEVYILYGNDPVASHHRRFPMRWNCHLLWNEKETLNKTTVNRGNTQDDNNDSISKSKKLFKQT